MNINPIYLLLSKISENPHINGLCNVFVMLLPVSLLSAFCMLIGNAFQLSGYNEIADTILTTSTLVWQLFPILLLFYYSSFLASYYKLSRATVITPSLIVYFIVCFELGLMHSSSVIPTNHPLAIFIPLMVSKIVMYVTKKQWFLDSDLPNVVDQSINLVVVTIVVVGSFSVLVGVLSLVLPGEGIVNSVFQFVDYNSLTHAVIYEFFRSLLWSIGLNGHIIFGPYKAELFEFTQYSFEQYQLTGSPLPILTSNFYDMYAGIGGAGNTMSLVLCMLFFTRNKGYRALAIATLALSVFNINEPIIFGLPVIFNPVLIIPFILVPIASLVLAYFATSLGLVHPISEIISWMTPAVISGYIATGNHVSGAILQLVIIALGVLMYYPFFKQMDRVIGSNVIFTKELSDRFFNYQELGRSGSGGGLLPKMSQHFSEQRVIGELQKTGEFVLFYQPQFDHHCKITRGVEVLLRHKSKDGVISPPTFLSSFNKLGLISELDLWVVDKALKEVAPAASNPNFKVSINISPDTFLVPDFAKIVIEMIEKSALNYNQVEFEITEDLLIQDEVTTGSVLKELRELGVKIALDDFGSGYSSIGYLSKFEFDKVKIDRSLVVNLKHKNGREMFRLTSKLVRTSGAEIVVEGVETQEEADFVVEQGIHLVQGYFHYKPMPFDAIQELNLFAKSTRDEEYEHFPL